MTRHVVDRMYFEGMNKEIDEDSCPDLSIHKSNFENWKLEFNVYEEEQLEFFKNSLRNGKKVEVVVYIQSMSRLTGKVMITNIEDTSIVAKGIGMLNGYRYIYNRGKFVTAF